MKVWGGDTFNVRHAQHIVQRLANKNSRSVHHAYYIPVVLFQRIRLRGQQTNPHGDGIQRHTHFMKNVPQKMASSFGHFVLVHGPHQHRFERQQSDEGEFCDDAPEHVPHRQLISIDH